MLRFLMEYKQSSTRKPRPSRFFRTELKIFQKQRKIEKALRENDFPAL